MPRCHYARGEWPTCPECDGRVHKADCNARLDPKRDCCNARHKQMNLPLRDTANTLDYKTPKKFRVSQEI